MMYVFVLIFVVILHCNWNFVIVYVKKSQSVTFFVHLI
jgi:hypothetical protein